MVQDAELSAKLAVQAREGCGKTKEDVRIFGCLPPICESHQPGLFLEFLKREGEDFVVRSYRSLAEALKRGGADTFIMENMVCWEEAELAMRSCQDLGLPLVLTMEGALRDLEREPHPENAPDIARKVLAAKKNGAPIEALGYSCTEPETILECLKAIEAVDGLNKEITDAGIALACYANVNDRREAHKKGFDVKTDKVDKIEKRADLCEDDYSGYLDFTKEFVKHGATWVGGCCGCGPEGIKRMSDQFCSKVKQQKLS